MLHNIKNNIKSNKYTKHIYNKLQCYTVLLQYKVIQNYYKHSKTTKVDCRKLNLNNEKLRIFYLGGDELQDKSGFLQALEKYSILTYFTKEDGSYGTYNYGILNRKKTITANKKRLLELLKQMDKPPHLLLMQTWEWRIGLETLLKIKKLYPNIMIVNIAMDDKHSFWIYGNKKIGSAGLIPALDTVFTTSIEAVEWYRKEGCPAYFYPLASDENIFKPLNIERKYDVGFVGAKYGIREKIINLLRNNGINVKAYGNGWKDGRLPLEETNKFYNQCKIVLGVGTILGCDKFISMKLRDFDVPLSGSVYLTTYNKDLTNIFKKDEEVVYYNSPQECVQQVISLLSDEERLMSIRKKALKKALQHTYSIRIRDLLHTLGIDL